MDLEESFVWDRLGNDKFDGTGYDVITKRKRKLDNRVRKITY